MTTANNELSRIYELVGTKLDDLGVYHEILRMRFGEYEIHASCFTRIIKGQDILVTTQDYQSWDEKEYKHNDMYYNIAKYGDMVIGGTVQSIEISLVNDLIIKLDNDVRIELFNSNGYHHFFEEKEQWFFYKPNDKMYPYLSVSSKSIDVE